MSSIFEPPVVHLLHHTPVSIAEVAARTCYDSFKRSKEESVRNWVPGMSLPESDCGLSSRVGMHHGSIVEHVTVNLHISRISRGLLQELVRHRIASPSVRSTRFTFGPIVALAVVNILGKANKREVLAMLDTFNIFTTSNPTNITRLLQDVIDIIRFNRDARNYLSPTQKEYIDTEGFDLSEFVSLNYKKNVGDNFKHLVTDAWATELTWSINVRSLRNFMELRLSDAAWEPIRELAEAVNAVLPQDIKRLLYGK